MRVVCSYFSTINILGCLSTATRGCYENTFAHVKMFSQGSSASRQIALNDLQNGSHVPSFFSVVLRPNAGHGLLILEVSRSHTTTQHSR